MRVCESKPCAGAGRGGAGGGTVIGSSPIVCFTFFLAGIFLYNSSVGQFLCHVKGLYTLTSKMSFPSFKC